MQMNSDYEQHDDEWHPLQPPRIVFFTFCQSKFATSPKHRYPQISQSSKQNYKTPWFSLLITPHTLPENSREASSFKLQPPQIYILVIKDLSNK
jgi:hypothetical protein